jgi:soluble lytic murein transglycosylase-like protein
MMEKVKWHHLPRGTHQRPEGKRTGGVGKMRCKAIFLIWGTILFWTLCPIRSEAAVSDQEEIPEEIIEYCEEIGPTYDICPELLEAIAWHESRFIEDVKNKNCWGLCQVNIKVHADRIDNLGYTSKDMLKAKPNIEVAADYLHELYETYGDDNPIILSLYSGAGWSAVEKYKENGTMTDYVEDILSRSARYERLHGK